jgi:hypothetical protein
MKNLDTLAQFRALEAELASITARRDEMAPTAVAQLEFLQGIESQAAALGLSNADVARFLNPSLAVSEKQAKSRKPHKPREMKVYVNPNTGATVETKGGNHKVLKAWKAEHGSDVVEGWRAAA